MVKPELQTRALTEDEAKVLLEQDLKSADQITLDHIRELLAYDDSNRAKYNPTDSFRLPAKRLYNEKALTTTVGRWLMNLLLLDEKLGPLLGYINEPLNGGRLGKLDNQMSDLLLDDKVTTEDFSRYVDKLSWLGFAIADFINPPLTADLMMAPEKVRKRKEELLKANKEALERGDIKAVSDIEKELLALAKEELKDIPDMDIYDSGSRGSYNNNYKMTAISRGPVKSVSDPSKTYVSTTSLEDGIKSDEQHIFADILTSASYSRAIGTRNGGYEAKKLAASFQTLKFGAKDSDCQTPKGVKIEITDANAKLLTNRYIVTNGGLTLLTDDNIKSYVGKVVTLRTPMYCRNSIICNKCAGELYYKLGIENVGLVSNVIGSSMTTLALKAFHDTSVKLKEINVLDYVNLDPGL